VADPAQLELIHAEIDGELDTAQRAELARRLLADPQMRSLREELRRLCTALDALAQAEPPSELRQGILAALPRASAKQSSAGRRALPAPLWRYAAVIAGVLAAGAVVTEMLRGPTPSISEVAGTLALAPAAILVDTVRLGSGPVSGSVALYRDRSALALRFEVTADEPVDVTVASAGHTIQVTGLGGSRPSPEAPAAVALPGVPMHGQSVDLTFLIDGHPVGRATLRAPRSL
jgi:anti-sigma factor RsiW